MRPRTNMTVAMKLLFPALLMNGIAANVSADHGRYRRSRTDVDIESLRATLRYDGGGWRVRVRSKVEIEDANPYSRFDLVLVLTERRRPLRDRSGRPLTLVVPLLRPSKIDDDEVEFRLARFFRLPAGAIGHPNRLRIHAEVVRLRDGRVLDRKSKSVRVKRAYYRPDPRPLRPITRVTPRY